MSARSAADDVLAIYDEPFLTVPVRVDGICARGFLSTTLGVGVDEDGQEVQLDVTRLRVPARALAGRPAYDTVVEVGPLGAEQVDGPLGEAPRTFRVREALLVDSGLVLELVVAEDLAP